MDVNRQQRRRQTGLTLSRFFVNFIKFLPLLNFYIFLDAMWNIIHKSDTCVPIKYAIRTNTFIAKVLHTTPYTETRNEVFMILMI